VVPLFRPYRAQVAAAVGLIVVTSTIGIINPLLIQAARSNGSAAAATS
jgi:ATP-binding cassette, subfamily B, bacterial